MEVLKNHGDVGMWSVGMVRMDWMILEAFSNLNGSVILRVPQ